ncbi:hypothetical protein F2Q69_00002664 [Brassica cretica]|uniref:Citrate transporter-like domain-containing protein n=1 Tax=Brassica cretica TaxID=69181 RepID=A0A8S9NY83_BRACR|nr:hypothetical protein F2Q69_00002664 [Brassica cretica]
MPSPPQVLTVKLADINNADKESWKPIEGVSLSSLRISLSLSRRKTIWIHGGKKRPEKLLTKSSSSAVTPPSRTVWVLLLLRIAAAGRKAGMGGVAVDRTIVGFVTFFLSSILDNLTSTIVMVSLLRKLVPQSEYRKLLGAVVVIAANAGGAWTPIGDFTTTMLWIHGLGVLWVENS